MNRLESIILSLKVTADAELLGCRSSPATNQEIKLGELQVAANMHTRGANRAVVGSPLGA